MKFLLYLSLLLVIPGVKSQLLMYILNSIPEAVQRINFTSFKQEAAKSQLLHQQVINISASTEPTFETPLVHASVVDLKPKITAAPLPVAEWSPKEGNTTVAAEQTPIRPSDAPVARQFSPKHSVEEINGRLAQIQPKNGAPRPQSPQINPQS